MDNVLTDFKQAVIYIGHEKALNDDTLKQDMYNAIEKEGPKFWNNMQWTPDGKDLWLILKPYKPIILSSPGKFKYAKEGKLLWISNNIPNTQVFFETDKYRYANMNSVLIDDDIKNTEPWTLQGGQAILHTSKDNTEQELLQLLWKKPWLNL